ncbi:MAG TPA: hypothetical protein VGF82_01110 [Terracidiphilus sp.]|jgi:ATP-dependent exoDNAse (exonuclease V) alpha subunit
MEGMGRVRPAVHRRGSLGRDLRSPLLVGDRVRFTAPNNDLKIANRELGTVENIGPDGTMRLKLDSERSVNVDPQYYPHLGHSSQGQTADRVLIHVDTELGARDLLNNPMAYVSVSRRQWDAQIFTNDREKLSQALGHDVSHQNAYKPEQSVAPIRQDISALPAHKQEPRFGLGLGM